MLFKNYINALAKAIGRALLKNNYVSVTDDRYYNYGVTQLLHRQSVEESANWIKQFINDAVLFHRKSDLNKYVVDYYGKSSFVKGENLFIEFGVASGASINFFSEHIKAQFYGFDTFEGMPEEWKGWNVVEGDFSTKGLLPEVNKNVTLIKGLIGDTLPPFLEKNTTKKIIFLHIDTDIYAPAKIILQQCKKYFVPGTLILFDELHSYTSWQIHEYKALMEELPLDCYKFIGFSDSKQGLLQIVKPL